MRFMQNFIDPRVNALVGINQRVVTGWDGDVPMACIDCMDIAECAAQLLTLPKADIAPIIRRAYSLSGSELLTGSQMAAMFTEHCGFPITYRQLDEAGYRRYLLERNLPPELVDTAMQSLRYFEDRHASRVESGVQDIQCRPPRGWQPFLKEHGHMIPMDEYTAKHRNKELAEQM